MNDCVEALENRVGIVSSADTASLTYRIATLETVLATQGAWSSWTPVFTNGATPTFTGSAYYHKVGRLVTATVTVSFTSAGTAANDLICTLPVTASSISAGGGSFVYYDTSAGSPFLSGSVAIEVDTTHCRFWLGGAQVGRMGNAGATVASGDTMQFTISYQSAS